MIEKGVVLCKKIIYKLMYFFIKSPYSFPKIDFQDYLERNYLPFTDSVFSFIQIGANDGVSHDFLYEFISKKKKIKGLVIEPIKEYFEILKKNYEQYPEVTPVNIAIHSELKKVVLYKLASGNKKFAPDWATGIASIYPHIHINANIETDLMEEEIVIADTFMNLYNTYHDFISNVDFIQIDVEGYDWQVLKMIDLNVLNPTIIKYEHKLLSKREFITSYRHLQKRKYKIFHEGSDIIAIKKADT
jgi:FkbM family methyltransferase